MRMEQRSPIQRFLPVTALLALGIGIGAWHNAQARQSKSDFVTSAVRGTLTIPASVLGRFGRWVGSQGSWLFAGRRLAAENVALNRRVGDLEAENTRLRESQIGYERLRTDLQFVQSLKKAPLAAEIWSRSPDP